MKNINDCNTVGDMVAHFEWYGGNIEWASLRAFRVAMSLPQTDMKRLLPIVMAATALEKLRAEMGESRS